MRKTLLETRKGGIIQFGYEFHKNSGVAIVEWLEKGETNECIELMASHICKNQEISPLKLIMFGQFEGKWNMVQFTEFYNGHCKIYKREEIDAREIQEFL